MPYNGVGNYVGKRVQIDSLTSYYSGSIGIVEKETHAKVLVLLVGVNWKDKDVKAWYKKENVKLLDEETEETMKPFSDNEKKVYLVYYDLDPNTNYDIDRLVTRETEACYYMTKREFEIEVAAENLDAELAHFVIVDNKLYQMKNVLELKEVQ